MDLENVGAHDAKMTQSDSVKSNDMSCDDVCAIAWKRYKPGKGAGKLAGKGAGKKGSSRLGVWHLGEGADEWTTGRRDDGGNKGGKKGSKGIKHHWYGDRDKRRHWKQIQRERQVQEPKPLLPLIAERKDISE